MDQSQRLREASSVHDHQEYRCFSLKLRKPDVRDCKQKQERNVASESFSFGAFCLIKLPLGSDSE